MRRRVGGPEYIAAMRMVSPSLSRLESRISWILGGPRTGSTWLMDLLVHPLMADASAASGVGRRVAASSVPMRAVPINEPYIGMHLAPIVNVHPAGVFTAADARADDPSYFFDSRWENAWRSALRRLILERLAAQARVAGRDHGVRDPLVVVKEPNGSHGAQMLTRTLPRSRLLVLWRDGRDVIDSVLDAVTPGGWLAGGQDTADVAAGGTRRMDFIRRNSMLWAHRIIMVQRAVAAHDPDRTLEIRYEELRADTAGQLRRIVDWLGLSWSDAALHEVVATHAFEHYPPAVKGRGRPLRRAAPGGWRDSLSRDEQAAMTELMGPTLADLGYA